MTKVKLDLAREAISRADFPVAIELLGELVAEDPENGEAWQELGVCYLETRRPDRAVEALTRAVGSGFAGATTHLLMGHACGSTGELEAAAACYRRALELDPQHAKAEEFLIKAESLLESREHYRSALKLLYSSEPGVQDLNRALRDLVHSIAIFDESPARDNLRECAERILVVRRDRPILVEPSSGLEPWIRTCERGYHCIRASNWAGARAAYDEALAYRVQDGFVHHALGFCFVELDEIEDAVRAWLRVLEIDPEYDFAQFGRVKHATR